MASIVNCVVEGNAFKIRAADWIPLDQWNAASLARRNDWMKALAVYAVELKREELKAGTDVKGKKLIPVIMKYRRDHAKGPPLIPHETVSRSWKWIRYSLGSRHLTFWWSHGWGRILGYHARTLKKKRDIIGLASAEMDLLQKFARTSWTKLNPPPFKLKSAPVRDQGRLKFDASPRPAATMAAAVEAAKAKAEPSRFKFTPLDPAKIKHSEADGRARPGGFEPRPVDDKGHFFSGFGRFERVRKKKKKGGDE